MIDISCFDVSFLDFSSAFGQIFNFKDFANFMETSFKAKSIYKKLVLRFPIETENILKELCKLSKMHFEGIEISSWPLEKANQFKSFKVDSEVENNISYLPVNKTGLESPDLKRTIKMIIKCISILMKKYDDEACGKLVYNFTKLLSYFTSRPVFSTNK